MEIDLLRIETKPQPLSLQRPQGLDAFAGLTMAGSRRRCGAVPTAQHDAYAGQAEWPPLQQRGSPALAATEQHLVIRDGFAGGQEGIADIALCPCTQCAVEGGFELADCSDIRAWLACAPTQSVYTAMQRTKPLS